MLQIMPLAILLRYFLCRSDMASGSALVCGFGNVLRIRAYGYGFERVFVESIFRAGMQLSGGKRNGWEESWEESERVVKEFYTRREHMWML